LKSCDVTDVLVDKTFHGMEVQQIHLELKC